MGNPAQGEFTAERMPQNVGTWAAWGLAGPVLPFLQQTTTAQAPKGLTADPELLADLLGLQPHLGRMSSERGRLPSVHRKLWPLNSGLLPWATSPHRAPEGEAGEDAEPLADGVIHAVAGPIAEDLGGIEGHRHRARLRGRLMR